MSEISEEEEFEFRLRAEQEAGSEESDVAVEETETTQRQRFLPSSMEETISEAGRVALKGVAGATGGLSEIGLKPIGELVGGESLKNLGLGVLLSKNLKDRIKAFSVSGGFDSSIMKDTERKTLNSEFGFPVPPQPETGIGKILGIGAEVIGGLRTGKNLETAVLKHGFNKLPSSAKIDSAIEAIDSNVKTNIAINESKLAEATTRTAFEEKMINKIRDERVISDLNNEMSEVAYSQAERVHGKPGEIGLAVIARKNLNKAYWKDAEPFFNKEVPIDDVIEGVQTKLQNHGIIDGRGEIVPGAEMSKEHGKLLIFYNKVNKRDPNGIVSYDLKKIKIGVLKKTLESELGRGHGSENLVSEIVQGVGEYVKELKEVNMKYVTDYQASNGVYDKFNVFTKIGWRRGDVSLNNGAKFFENLASEDPSKINRDFVKEIDFLKKYSGEDPSEPVRGLSNEILNVKKSALDRQFKAMNSLDEMGAKISKNAERSLKNGQEMIGNLKSIGEFVKNKEAFKARIKNTAVGAAKLAVGGSAVGGGMSVVGKLFK